ncbi:MAG TPA: pre-peptidase C-terminal domain-containing protein [Gaiellaceae bacterium]
MFKRGHRNAAHICRLAGAFLGAALAIGILTGSSSAAVDAHRSAAVSQELPPLGALSPIEATSVQWAQTGSPTFRWKFPARDGSEQHLVTMDDSALGMGHVFTSPDSDVVAAPVAWNYLPNPQGAPLLDGTWSGPGWALYFTSNKCGGAANFLPWNFDPSLSGPTCPVGGIPTIKSELEAVPGAWIAVGPDFAGCVATMTQMPGAICLARFIPAAEMSLYVKPISDVEVWNGQPWDVSCPANQYAPACWTGAPAPVDLSVEVKAFVDHSPVDAGTTSDGFSIEVSNVNDHQVVVSSISADLAEGFTYVSGSTSGALTSEPAIDGRRLTWRGPFVRPAHSNLLFGFNAAIAPELSGGDYTMTASAVTDKTYSGAATLTIADARVPLIFVPGIMGSELSCGGANWWPTFAADKSGSLFQGLALANHGNDESTCLTPLAADGIVDSAFGSKKYGATIDALVAAGYVPGRTLFTYPYDWRKSVTSGAGGLLAQIDAIRAHTHAAQVDILAHSQGGLVTRVALADPASVGKVRRVLTMATPFYGAAKLLSVLITGKPCIPGNVFDVHVSLWHIAYCPTNGPTVQQVLRTLPGPHDLLPSLSYFDAVRPPIRRDGVALTPTEYQSYVRSISDPVLVDSAFQYHATYDARGPADPNVQWKQIVGHGDLTTIGNVFLSSDPQLDWATVQYADGDGTVPSGSAQSGGLFPTGRTDGIDHMGIATESCTLEFAVEYFQFPTSPPFGGCVGADTASTTRAFARTQSVAPAGVELALDGSLTAVVSDGSGHNTDATIEDATIPNSDYNAAGESQSFLFRDPGSYHAAVTSTAPRIARVRVRRLGLDGPIAQALFLIPTLPSGARLSLDFTSGDVAAARVDADLNGDGTTDEVLAPDAVTSGVAAEDTTAPNVAGGATLDGLLSSTVTLTADDSDSGVAHIYYRIGSGAEQTYTGPFTSPMFSTISFRAMDAAGNVSGESTLVADDAPNTRAFADQLTPLHPILRFLDPRGDVDWFSFQANGTARYRVQLYQLPGDYDLQLFDANGALVAAPRVRGRGAEEIFRQLPAGKYYVEITAAADTQGANRPWDRFHPYGLQLISVPGQ